MSKWTKLVYVAAFMVLAGCGRQRDIGDGDVLAIGDSIIEWNFKDYASIPDFVAKSSGLAADNAAIAGSRVLDTGEEGIPQQYVSKAWRWVVIDGGANDLGDAGCNCSDCGPTIDQIVSEDLDSGAMPTLLDRIEADGAKVVLLGYYSVPSGTEFDECGDEMEVLNTRYEALANARDEVYFYSMGEVVSPDDLSLFDVDRVHPSPAGSEAIGLAVGELIKSVD